MVQPRLRASFAAVVFALILAAIYPYVYKVRHWARSGHVPATSAVDLETLDRTRASSISFSLFVAQAVLLEPEPPSSF